MQVTVGGRPERYFRIAPEGAPLVVQAEGPVALAFKLRVLRPGKNEGAIRITRDEEAYSVASYGLDRDANARVSPDAAAEDNAATTEQVIHMNVDAGVHRYALTPVRGSTILLRVQKPAKFDAALAPGPEKRLAVDPSAPEKVRPEPVKEPPPTPPAERAPPPRSVPPKEPAKEPAKEPVKDPAVARAATRTRESEAGSGPAANRIAQPQPAPAPPVVAIAPAASVAPRTQFAPVFIVLDESESAAPSPPPPRSGGWALGVRAGMHAYQGDLAAMPSRLAIPIAFELARDLGSTWSLSLEGGYYQSSIETVGSSPPEFSEFVALTTLRAAPVSLGLTAYAALSEYAGLRVRIAGTGAWIGTHTQLAFGGGEPVDQPGSSAWGLGGTGGLAFEVATDPGHITIEGRYTYLRTDFGFEAVRSASPARVQSGDVGGAQLLAGFRLEL